MLSYYYAVDVVKKRWLPGEPAILTDALIAAAYRQRFMPDGWPEAEKGILQDGWLREK